MQALRAFQDNSNPPDLPRQEVSRDQIIKYLDTFGLTNELSEQEKSQFVEIAEAYQLNPFKREIYAVPYGEGLYRKLSIITGFEVYLKRAERSGKLDGWKAWVEGDSEDNFKAMVEIYRRDWQHPFTHTVYWKEAVQRKKDGTLTQFWKKMPRYQLRKVCISQGFRLCFPEDLAGIPYTSDELPEEMTQINTQSSQPAKSTHTPSGSPDSIDGNSTANQILDEHEPSQEDPRLMALSNCLSEHENCFTENHSNWILSQLKNNPSDENIRKMEAHVQEVIKSKTVIKPLKRMENSARQRENSSATRTAQYSQPVQPLQPTPRPTTPRESNNEVGLIF